MTSADSSWVQLAFLERFLADRDRGRRLPLSEYLALWPDHQDRIAQEYLALQTSEDPPPAEPARDATLGTIGPYRIVRELGRGGQAIVYLAEDPRLGRQVALKALPVPLGRSGAAAKRLRREAEAMSRLHHPGVCPVYDVGEEGSTGYVVMRYVEGVTLARHLGRREGDEPATLLEGARAAEALEGTRPHERANLDLADVPAVVHFFEKAARALHAVHELGFIHRDVKPGNIMVDPGGEPVILDFGLARDTEALAGDVTLTGDIVGTPAYLSPEQIAGAGTSLDRRTDVWSLGVTLFEALSGRRPFEAPVRSQLYKAVLEQDPPGLRRLAPVSKDLASVVATALEKDRDRRYTTAAAFADDLERVRLGRAVSARRVGPLRRAGRTIRRHPAASAGLLLAFLVLVAGLAYTLELLDQTEQARTELQEALERDRERLDLFRGLAARLTRTIEAEALTVAGSVGARMRFATQLREAMEVLRAETEDSPELSAQLAGAWMQLGDVKGSPASPNLGDPDGARRDYAEARRVLAEARTRHPEHPYLEDASIKLELRELALMTGAESTEAFRSRARTILELTAARTEAGDVAAMVAHSSVLELLGDLARREQSWDEAARCYESCLAMKRRMVGQSATYTFHVPHIATKLAGVELARRRLVRAEELLLLSLEDAGALRAAAPTSTIALDKAGDAWFQVGALREALGQPRAALAAFQESAWIRAKLLGNTPADAALYRGVLATLDRTIAVARAVEPDLVPELERQRLVIQGSFPHEDRRSSLEAARELLRRSSRFEDRLRALSWMRQAAHADPEDAGVCGELAVLSQQTGLEAEARRWARRGLEALAPGDPAELEERLRALLSGR